MERDETDFFNEQKKIWHFKKSATKQTTKSFKGRKNQTNDNETDSFANDVESCSLSFNDNPNPHDIAAIEAAKANVQRQKSELNPVTYETKQQSFHDLFDQKTK